MAFKTRSVILGEMGSDASNDPITISLSGCKDMLTSPITIPAGRIINFIYEPSGNVDDPDEGCFIATSHYRHFIISGEAYFEGFTFKSTMEPEDTSSPRAYGGFKINGGTATFQSCNFVDIARAGDLTTDLGGIFSVDNGNLSVIGTLNNPESVTVNLAYPVENAAHGGFVAATGTSAIHLENLQISGSVDGNGGVIYAIDNPTVTLSNLTLSDLETQGSGGAIYQEDGSLSVAGSVISGNYSNRGGGIYMEGIGAILSIANTQITANASNNNGGAIFLDNNVIATLTGVTIDTNAASLGAGIYSNQSQLILNQVEISNHTDWAVGGGIYMVGGSLLADSQTRIYENQKTTPVPSTSQGGGIYVDALSYPATITLNGTQIDNNLAYAGAGIFLNGNSTANLNAANLQTNSATYGGGIYHSGTSLTLTNTTLEGNSVSQNGGGIYHGQGTLTVNGGAFNWNFANAEPSGRGGALYMKAGTATLQGDLQMTYNFAGQYGGAVAVIADLNAQTTANLTVTGNAQVGKIDGEYPAGNTAGQTGGGIYFDSAGTLTVSQNAKVEYNTATDANGGGIAITALISGNSGDFQLQDNASVSYNQAPSTDNESGRGGGIYFRQPNTIATLTGGTIAHNTAGRYGGGLFSASNNINLSFIGNDPTPLRISYNEAQNSGGGIFSNTPITLNHANLLMDYNSASNGGGIASNGAIILTNGSLQSNTATTNGGGIYTTAPATLTNSLLDQNSAPNGGGIYTSANLLTLSNATISNNTAHFGGGIFLTAVAAITGTATIQGNTAQNNGGGICTGESLDLSNSVLTIDNNTATIGNGGGILVENNKLLTLAGATVINNKTPYLTGTGCGAGITMGGGSISNSTFKNNVAGNTGGAIFSSTSALTLSGSNLFDSNQSGGGGAVYANYGLTVTDPSTFKNNTAVGNGGAIRSNILGGDTAFLAPVTIFGNTCGGSAGGGAILTDGNLTFTGGHLYDNHATGGNGGAIWLGARSNTATLSGIEIDHNTAHNNGGAVYINISTNLIVQPLTDPETEETTSTHIHHNEAENNGGGIYQTNGASTLTNLSLTENIAHNTGGALHIANGDLTANGCTFTENQSNAYGGAVMQNSIGNVNFTDCEFGLNKCLSDFTNGGAISNGDDQTSTHLTLIRCEIHHNTSPFIGGGLYNSSQSTVTIEDCHVHHNEAKAGGGLSIGSDNASYEHTITGTSIHHNIASDYWGGGLRIAGGTLHIEDTQILENTAPSGGGISTDQPGSTHPIITLTNTALQNNIANASGGAIYLQDATLTATKTTLQGITPPEQTDNPLTGNIANLAETSDPVNAVDGGAFYINNATLNLTGTEIANHTVTNKGGGIYLTGNGTLNMEPLLDPETVEVTPTRIHHNTADQGGGIYQVNGTLNADKAHVFANNSVTPNGIPYQIGGGGMILAGGEAHISNSEFRDNTAVSSGGAISQIGGTLEASNTKFYLNIAGTETVNGDGGAVTTSRGNADYVACYFQQNQSRGFGGAFYLNNSSFVTMKDSEISDNACRSGGGGGCMSNSTVLTVTNSQISGNTSVGAGGGIRLRNGSPIENQPSILNLIGTTISDHSLPNQQGGGIYMADSLLTLNLSSYLDPETEAITPTQIHHNTAKQGGGIYHSGGTVDIQKSELHQNTAHHGGAIYTTNYSNLTIDHDSTFTQNTADTVNNIVNPTDVAIYQDNVHVDPIAWSYQYPNTHDIAIGYNEADINEHDITVHYHIYDGAATPITGDIHYTDDFETALGQTAQNQLPNLEGLKLADRWYIDPECTTPFNFTTGTYQDNLDLYTYDNVADDQETFTAIFNAVENDSNDCHYSDALTDFDTILIRGLQDTSPSVPLTSPFQIQGQRLAITLQNYYPEGGFITLTGNFRHFNVANNIDITFKNVQLKGNNGDPTVGTIAGGGIGTTGTPTIGLIGDNSITDFENIAYCYNTMDGAGVQTVNGSSLNISGNLVIAHNRSTRWGGGVRVFGTNNSTFTMTSGEIRNNYSEWGGGGLMLGTSGNINLLATISGGRITGNTSLAPANGNGGGGGISVYGADLTISGDTEISHNHSTYAGGGIYLTTAGAKLTLDGGIIAYNLCDHPNLGGGGMLIGSNTLGLTMNGGIVEHNMAQRGAGIFNQNTTVTLNGGTIRHNGFDFNDENNPIDSQKGGGVYNRSLLIITGGTIESNGAEYGGGIFSTDKDGSGASNGRTIEIHATNATITGNIATTEAETGIGGGVYVETGTATFTTSEISRNTADLYGGGISSLNSSLDLIGTKIFDNQTLAYQLVNVSGNEVPKGMGGGVFVRNTADNTSSLHISSYETVDGEENSVTIPTEIHDNISDQGGGILLYGSQTELTADGMKVYGNHATYRVVGGAYGAGGLNVFGGIAQVQNSHFYENTTENLNWACGGAMLVRIGGAVLTVTDTLIENNTAQLGGGVYAANYGTFNAERTIFLNNKATTTMSSDGGGAMEINQYATANLTDCNFESNKSNGNGGAICVHTGTTVIGDNLTIFQNSALGNGGGIVVDNSNATLLLKNSILNENYLQNVNKTGGGIHMIDGAVTLQHTTIKNHAINGNGGAIYVTNGSLTLNPDPDTNQQNEIYQNSTTKNGGAIYQAGGTVTINDSNFHDNTAPVGRGGAIYTYNYEKLDINDASEFKNNSALNRNNQVTPPDEAIYLDHVFVPDEEWSFAFPDAPVIAVGYNESDIQYPLYYINYLIYDGTEEITGNVRFTENFQTYLTETAEAQLQSLNPDIALCQTWFKDASCTEAFDFQNGPYSDGMTLYSYDNVADDHGTFNGLFTGASSSVHAFANIFPVILVRGDQGFTLQEQVRSVTSRTVKLQAYDDMAIITSAVNELHFQLVAPEYEITFKNVQLSGQNNDATVDGVRGGGIDDGSYPITLHLIGENDSDDFPNIANCNGTATIQSKNPILSGNLRIENNRGQNGGGLRPYAYGNTIIKDQVKFIGNVSVNKGGAINIAGYDPSYLIIQDDVQFIGNTALGDGGAIEISGGNIATINGNVQFIGNTGARGGAIRTSGTVTISGNVLFEGNTANGQVDPYNSYSGPKGGAIYVGSSTVHIEDASFQTNHAVFGGAIYLDLDTTSVTVAGDTKFQGNVASLDGGGIFAEVYEELFIEQDVEFQNNTAHKNALVVTEAHRMVYASNVQASLWSLDTLHSPVNAQGYNNYDVNYANVTIHFESGGGSGSMPDQYVAVNEPTDLNPCTFYKLPCEFIGWDLAESPITTDTDVVLTAQWDCAELVCCEPAPDGEPGEQGPQGEPGTPIIPAALTAKILPDTTNQFHFQELQKVGTAITLEDDQFTIDEPGTYTVHWWLALHGTDNLQNTVTIQLAGQPVTSHQVSEHLSGMHHFQVGDEPLIFTLKTDDTVKVVDGAILIVR